ncbi:hypothetical protein ABIB83_008726 [Bradyrhizobium sp. I1.8.5]|uniref:hypothetical protein n=1 Tax=unclassified Bradyrhizobium TaxID=2631580 RepID=UPI003392D9BF
MSKTAVKKLEKQNAELETKALHEQVGAFFHELDDFIHSNYCPRLTAWFEAHWPDQRSGKLLDDLAAISPEDRRSRLLRRR